MPEKIGSSCLIPDPIEHSCDPVQIVQCRDTRACDISGHRWREAAQVGLWRQSCAGPWDSNSGVHQQPFQFCPLSKPGRGYSLVAGRSIVLMQAAGTLSGQPRFRVAVVWVEWRLFSGQTGQASYHGRKLADAAIVIRDPSPRVEPMAKCRTLEPAPIMKDSLVRLTHCPSSRSFRRLVRRS